MSKKTFDKLREQDARRSATARAIDNKIKAPIDNEGTRWHNQPNRYDVRGIDDPKTRNVRLKRGTRWPIHADEDAQIIR